MWIWAALGRKIAIITTICLENTGKVSRRGFPGNSEGASGNRLIRPPEFNLGPKRFEVPTSVRYGAAL